jgi:hypothetical protein
LIFNKLTYNIKLRDFSQESQLLQTYADEHGGSSLLQLFSQSRLDLLPGLVMNLGVHSQLFTLNKNMTIEPRTSLKWKITRKHSLSMAYGMHSRLEPIGFYFAQQNLPAGTVQPNRNLRLTKAQHVVLAYEMNTGNYSRLRIEPFYQKLFDVPVIPRTSFSMLNLEMDWFFNDSLVNKGTGTNLCVDITLERFLHAGYYYLITGSLFDSKYKGGDYIERDARFNKNYVFNFLFGKELTLGREKNNVIGLNWRFSLLGGDRIDPVNDAASIVAHDVVYDENNAFTDHKPAVYYLDFTVSWQRNKPNYAATWSFQFVNLLFQNEFYGYRYNFRTGKVDPQKEAVAIPNFSYRIDF